MLTSNGTLKIIDFGLAAYIPDANKFKRVGTPKTMAPEIIEGQYIYQYFKLTAFQTVETYGC